jgi:hypothetical protein
MNVYTSTAYVDVPSGYVLAETSGTNLWSDRTSWATMLWGAGYTNPMMYYTTAFEVPANARPYNISIDTKANGKVSYRIVESNDPSFQTIYDREPLIVTAANGITTSSAVVKYGSNSIAFNGTNQYATIADDDTLDLGSGPFTIEAWVKLNAIGTSPTREQYIFYKGTGTNALALFINGNYPIVRVGSGGFIIGTGGTAMTTSTWYHIAASRDASGVVRIFQDGTCLNTGTTTATVTNSYDAFIGRDDDGISNTTSSYFTGYIDDLRISNTARYTGAVFSTFTPPTATLVNDTSTVFLCTAEVGVADTPNILEEVTITVVNDGDSGIPAFTKRYAMVGVQVDSIERGTIYSTQLKPNQNRLSLLLNNVDVSTLENSATTSTSKVLDLGRETSAILAVFPQKSNGLVDIGLLPVVANKTEPAVAFIKSTEGAQDYVYGGLAESVVDPSTLTDPTIDVVVHVLPEQYMTDGVLTTR